VTESKLQAERHVTEIMLAMRESVAARAARLAEELSRIHELVASLASTTTNQETGTPLAEAAAKLHELTQALGSSFAVTSLDSSFAVTPEETFELGVFARPPGHSRPFWHPKRWVAAMHQLFFGRQYMFNQRMLEHLVRLAHHTESFRQEFLQILPRAEALRQALLQLLPHTEALQQALLQVMPLVAHQTQRVLFFERQGFETLLELLDGIESTLRVLLAHPAPTNIQPQGGESAQIKAQPEATSANSLSTVASQLRDELGAIGTRLTNLEEKFSHLKSIETTVALTSKRVEELDAALSTSLDDIRNEIEALRELARRARSAEGTAPSPPRLTVAPPTDRRSPLPAATSFSFLDFEAATRGDEQQVTREQTRYIEWFTSAGAPVLDVGCGRGEFLELLRDHGVDARGIDRDADMVAHCRSKGLQVEQADLFEYLRALPDESLGGVFLGHVIEHLEQPLVLALPQLIWSKLVPGGALVIETPNPMCLSTFAGALYADPTHIRPIHPKGLEYLLTAAGFHDLTLMLSAPVPESAKLQPLQEKGPLDPVAKDLVLQMNENLDRLNQLLYSYANYAMAARKPR
jgi:2-polyprenyl-3-methyl-5-hydroxy-6-metoxy-1,4-benzoquinol methylase